MSACLPIASDLLHPRNRAATQSERRRLGAGGPFGSAQEDRAGYLPAAATSEVTVLNVVCNCEPRALTTAMIATEIPAAINPDRGGTRFIVEKRDQRPGLCSDGL
jgi:hypothetical protein